MLVGPHDRGIQNDNAEINPLQALEYHEDIPPHAALHPPLPAPVNGVPVPVRRWSISPWRARAQDMPDPFEGLTIPDLGRSAAPAVLRGSQAVDLRKLRVRQIVEAIH